jgi:hypothetical protein
VNVAYLYGFWLRSRSRCYNSEDTDYPEYGRKGIALAKNWRKDYPAFRDWIEENLGPRPSLGYRLERWDRKKSFEPGNLLWVTEAQAYLLRKGLSLIKRFAPLFSFLASAALLLFELYDYSQ